MGPFLKAPSLTESFSFPSANQNGSIACDSIERGLGWAPSASWLVPHDWPSDLYVAWFEALRRDGTTQDAFNVPFIVRPAGSTPTTRPFLPDAPLRIRSPILEAVPSGGFGRLDRLYGPPPERLRERPVRRTPSPSTTTRGIKRRKVVCCFPTSTWAAYGNLSPYRHDQVAQDGATGYDSVVQTSGFYDGAQRSRRISLDSPLGGEIPLRDVQIARFLLERGIDYDACSSLDLHADPKLLDPYGLIVFGGHDEYWSAEMRANLDRFVEEGGNAAVFSGNTCWWQVRFEPAPDGTPDRVMICTKSPFEDPVIGTPDPTMKSEPWRATVEFAALPASRPENTTFGLSYRFGAQYPGGDYDLRGFTMLRSPTTPWAAPFLAGTGLKAGEVFANTAASAVLGYETDGAEGALALSPFGAPSLVLTHADGTPNGAYPFAYAHLPWERFTSPGLQGGNAIVLLFRRGAGMVFHAGTTEWPLVLGRPPGDEAAQVVRTFAGNAIDVLSQRSAAELGIEPADVKYRDPMDLPGKGVEWTEVPTSGLPAGARIVAITGHIEGHLFGVSNTGRLYRRAPLPFEGAWTLVPTPAGSPTMTALGSDLIIYCGILGCSGNRLYIRAPTLAEAAPWTLLTTTDGEIGGVGVPVVARHLLIGDWLGRVGEGATSVKAPDLTGRSGGMRLLTAVDRTLVGVVGDELVVREPIVLDVRNRRAGSVPTDTIALTNYYGALYALRGDGKLFFRAAGAVLDEPAGKRLSAVHPGYLVAYRGDPLEKRGRCALYAFHPDGNLRLEARFESRTDIPGNCTHVVGCADDRHLLFVGKGPIQVASVTAFSGKLELVGSPLNTPVPAPDAQWTSAVAIARGRVLVYARGAGEGKVIAVTAAGDAKVLTVETSLPKGAIVVAATERFELLFYAATGETHVGRWNPVTRRLVLTKVAPLGAGFTHGAGIGHAKILLIDAKTRTGRVVRLEPGVVEEVGLPSLPGQLVPATRIEHLVGGVNGLVVTVSGAAADPPIEAATAGITDAKTSVRYQHLRYCTPSWLASSAGPWTAFGAV